MDGSLPSTTTTMCLDSGVLAGSDVPNLSQALQVLVSVLVLLWFRIESRDSLEKALVSVTELCSEDVTTVKRVCLLTWTVMAGSQVPPKLQLEAFLAIHRGRDSLFVTGTGSGKTSSQIAFLRRFPPGALEFIPLLKFSSVIFALGAGGA